MGKKTGRPIVPSIDLSSAQEFLNRDELISYHEDPHSSIRYGRDSSSISLQIEHYLSAIYQKPAHLFNSGMAALGAALEVASLSSKDVVVLGETYRKTESQLAYMLKSGAISSIARIDNDSINKARINKSSIILFESISNPHLRVADLELLSKIKSESNAVIICDATLAGIDNQQSLHSRFDFVIHSATKYINGFNDVVAGVLLEQ